MVPLIEYGLGYQPGNKVQPDHLNHNSLNPKPYNSNSLTVKLTLTLTLKVKIMYAVQNDTEIKFNIVL